MSRTILYIDVWQAAAHQCGELGIKYICRIGGKQVLWFDNDEDELAEIV